MQRITPECSTIARQFQLCNLIELSSYVVCRVQSITSCHSMSSSGIEFDTGDCKDNVPKSVADDEVPAKRQKTSDSSLENNVSIIHILFALACLL